MRRANLSVQDARRVHGECILLFGRAVLTIVEQAVLEVLVRESMSHTAKLQMVPFSNLSDCIGLSESFIRKQLQSLKRQQFICTTSVAFTDFVFINSNFPKYGIARLQDIMQHVKTESCKCECVFWCTDCNKSYELLDLAHQLYTDGAVKCPVHQDVIDTRPRPKHNAIQLGCWVAQMQSHLQEAKESSWSIQYDIYEHNLHVSPPRTDHVPPMENAPKEYDYDSDSFWTDV